MSSPLVAEDSDWFEATTSYTESLSCLIKALGTVSKIVSLHMTEQGLTFDVLDSSYACSATLFLENAIFGNYKTPHSSQQEDSEVIIISLEALAHSLEMLLDWESSAAMQGDSLRKDRSGNTRCTLRYRKGASLELHSTHQEMTCVCTYSVLSGENVPSYVDAAPQLDRDDIRLHLIVRGKTISDAIKELDIMQSTQLVITASQRPPQLSLVGVGDLATTKLVIQPGHDVVELFEVNGRTSFNYAFGTIAKAREALKLASRLSLRYDGKGTLSMQAMHEFDGNITFLEFCFLATVSS